VVCTTLYIHLISHFLPSSPTLTPTSIGAQLLNCIVFPASNSHCLSNIIACALLTNMTTPTRRVSTAAHIAANIGPSRSVLQRLLEEINGAGPSVCRDFDSRQMIGMPSASVWVPRSEIAQDARDKLHASDESRQRTRSTDTNSGGNDLTTGDQMVLPLLRCSSQPTGRPSEAESSLWKTPPTTLTSSSSEILDDCPEIWSTPRAQTEGSSLLQSRSKSF
jgi:hypothetical protein